MHTYYALVSKKNDISDFQITKY